LGYIVFRLAQT